MIGRQDCSDGRWEGFESEDEAQRAALALAGQRGLDDGAVIFGPRCCP